MQQSVVKDDQIVTTTIDKDAKKSLDKSLTVKDKLLVVLQMWASQRETNEIYTSIDDLAAMAGVHRPTAQTTLNTMAAKREIEIIKEERTGSRAAKVIGFILKKATPPEQIIASGVEKAKASPKVAKRLEPKILSSLVHIKKYLDQREAVDKARAILADSGVEAVVNFQENPLAEEAVQVVHELIETTRLLGECRLEQEANRRIEG